MIRKKGTQVGGLNGLEKSSNKLQKGLPNALIYIIMAHLETDCFNPVFQMGR